MRFEDYCFLETFIATVTGIFLIVAGCFMIRDGNFVTGNVVAIAGSAIFLYVDMYIRRTHEKRWTFLHVDEITVH